MTARGRRLSLGFGMAALAAAVLFAAPRPRAGAEAALTPGERARAFYVLGLDRWARGEEREMLAAMWAAWQATPGYLPPLLEAAAYYSELVPQQVRAALDSIATHSAEGIGYCASLIRALLEGRKAPAPPRGAVSEPCAWYATLSDRHRTAEPAPQLAAARALFNRYPESPAAAGAYLAEMVPRGWSDSLAFWAHRLTEDGNHLLLQAIGHTHFAPALHALGRHDEALIAERRAAAFAAVSPPRARARIFGMYENAAHRGRSGAEPDSRWPRHADSLLLVAADGMRALRSTADAVFSLSLRLGRAGGALDNGDLAASLAQWDTLAARADSLAEPTLQAFVYMRRGRTRVKLGNWEGAERDLLIARGWAARQPDLRKTSEVEHNLLHLYEALGRDADARRAGEAFVALTMEGGLQPVRMMSHRDLGWFLHRRGEPETARRHFEAMVADLDSLNDPTHSYEFFAGEYYELIGDLDRALRYYEEAAAQADPSRSLEALARVAEATGDLSAALTHVRRHDRIVETNNPEFRPLLPGLLMRSGRLKEAADELGRARAAAARRGQVAGWARLTLDLADLALQWGRFTLAIAAADSAAGAAERVGDAETRVRAISLGGAARVARGGPGRADGVAALRRAAGRAAALALPQLEADVLVMLGDGLATTSRPEQALVAFRRAATLSDSIALSLAHDPARAGFRGASQRRVSDRALTAILARADDPRAAGWYAEWTLWRKGRGIAGHGAASPRAPWGTGGDGLTRIRSQLGSSRVVIDFAVLDSAVAALVVTDAAARIVRLPVSADTVTARVEALYRGIAPRLGSFVDQARSVFDLALARRLYQDLLEPLLPLLEHRTSLTIVADAPLHLLPFDALVSPAADSVPVYALERYTISLATSLTGLDRRSVAELPPGPVLALGGPAASGVAAGMDREIEALAGSVGRREVERYTAGSATEAVVRARAARAAVLHFAAHARPNEHQPDYGAITLAPGGGDDGLLHAYEIRDLDLAGGLVVLSACESAAGRLAGGEGALSLSRAFLQAGASAVVGTLWPVGPATIELMQTFYRELAAGLPPADALRSAKLSLRHGRHANPLHWAAFTLTARGR